MLICVYLHSVMQKQLDRIERSVTKIAEDKTMATSSTSLQTEVKVCCRTLYCSILTVTVVYNIVGICGKVSKRVEQT